MWNDAVVTNGGKTLLAEWFNGGQLTIAEAATGEGTVTPSLLMGQTALVARKQTMSIIKTEKIASGMRLQLQLTSEGVTKAYTANQIGLWAKLDDGENTLIALYQDDTGISVPTHDEMPDYVFTFYATVQMSNEGEITVSIDTTALVTRADFNAESQARQTAEEGLQKNIEAEETERKKALKAHTDDKENPHDVTQKQLLDALAVVTEMADDDVLPIGDTSAGTAAKISKADLKKALGLNSITGATVTLGATLTYTGNTLTKTVSSVVLNGTTLTAGTDYVVSGNTAVNAGTYTLVITGIGKYAGSIGKTWEIVKASGSVSTSTSSLSVVGAVGATRTFTVSRSGDGAITVDSADPTVAQATISGTTVTVKAVKGGSTTIIVNVDAGTNHKATSRTVAVTTTIADATLNNNSWETIRAISDAGAASSVWSVGATKEIAVKGTVGTLSIDQKLWVFILGFNHNATYEGSNKIHFQGFKTAQSGGTDVGLVDSKYNSSYTDGTKYFNVNHWGYPNYGGWAACDLRYDVLGSTNVAPGNYGSAKASGATGSDATNTCATNPVSGTLMAALPADLRAVMKPITKYTDNVAGGTNVSSNIKATVDYLPLLAEFEVFGSRSYANSYEKNYQAQYAYYAN
ncbi:MAG: hypothetical protein NC548_52535, partial [Lachnospiraceae bacterium]|nr:hypothetical protein [Lachnospiraceae bacterium]